ncbi:Sua5 YciO YrdC YwlC family protein, partial [Campylobacter jejuni]
MIYLAQTDTTVGFLSKNLEEINALKGRDKNHALLWKM